jgi:hypothetical protein
MKNKFLQTVMLLSFITVLSTSCFKNFYLTNSKKVFTKIEAEIANTDPNKYIIIHFKDQNLELTKYTITTDSIIGEINKLEIPEHLLCLTPNESSSNSYKKKYESAVLNEIHVYTSLTSNLEDTNHIQIASKDITRIDIYQKDINRTISNHVLSSLGVVGSFLGLSYLILIISPFTFALGSII